MSFDIKKLGSYTYEMPEGWIINFGSEMFKEIFEVYNNMSEQEKEDFDIIQIKEKFGELRIYFTTYTPELRAICEKYREKSRFVCSKCGDPATVVTTDWICPYCDDHVPFLRNNLRAPSRPVDVHFAKWDEMTSGGLEF